jgi:hypothetical protein
MLVADRRAGGRAALDLDVLAELVAIALVAAVVAELEPQHARHRRAQGDPAPWWWRCWSPIAAVTMRVVLRWCYVARPVTVKTAARCTAVDSN